MAVENQSPPLQPASPRPATSREIIQIAGAAIALVAVVFAGMSLVVSMTLAPVREDMRLMREDIRLLSGELADFRRDTNDGFKAVDAEFKAMDDEFRAMLDVKFEAVDDEFKAVREDLAGIRERLTRVETLLEQGAGQPEDPESARPERTLEPLPQDDSAWRGMQGY